MHDPIALAMLAVSALAGLSILSFTLLRGWNGWLDLQRGGTGGTARLPAIDAPSSAARIEMADLRERVRKLEAIAAGVDL